MAVRSLAALVALLIASPIAAEQRGHWTPSAAAFGHFTWGPPVANLGALPTCNGASDGLVRVVLDTGAGDPGIRQCVSGSWEEISGSGDALLRGANTGVNAHSVTSNPVAGADVFTWGDAGGNLFTLRAHPTTVAQRRFSLRTQLEVDANQDGDADLNLSATDVALRLPSDPTRNYLTLDGGSGLLARASSDDDHQATLELQPSGHLIFDATNTEGDASIRFSAELHTLLLTAAGAFTLDGVSVCLEDGTNCPSGGAAGGSDTQVQFNDGGAFGGDADYTWNKTTNVLAVGSGGSLVGGNSTSAHTLNILPNAGTGQQALVFGNSSGDNLAVTFQAGNSADFRIKPEAGAYATFGLYDGATRKFIIEKPPANTLTISRDGNSDIVIQTTGLVTFGVAARLTPRSAPPVTCGDAGTEGVIYDDSDGSKALCWCNGTAWVVVAGAGACS